MRQEWIDGINSLDLSSETPIALYFEEYYDRRLRIKLSLPAFSFGEYWNRGRIDKKYRFSSYKKIWKFLLELGANNSRKNTLPENIAYFSKSCKRLRTLHFRASLFLARVFNSCHWRFQLTGNFTNRLSGFKSWFINRKLKDINKIFYSCILSSTNWNSTIGNVNYKYISHALYIKQ